jgi:NAD(P)H-hydrate epimerase
VASVDENMAGARWTMHWEEAKVFDVNAVALGVDELDLMMAAGKALSQEVGHYTNNISQMGEVWFLCGSGNNGGDGFVAAEEFLATHAQNHEIQVRVLATHGEQKTLASRIVRARLIEGGIPIHVWDSGRWSLPLPTDRRILLLVDCMLGVGQGGPGESALPRGCIAEVMDWLDSRFEVGFPSVLACDVPTGWGSSRTMIADWTLTFHSDKIGLTLENGNVAPGIGPIRVAELPWPQETVDPGPGDLIRYPPLSSDAKKGDRGRVLVVGGGPYHGAPLLAGMAAARMGADLIHVAMPENAAQRADWPAEIIPEILPDKDHLSIVSVERIVERMEAGRGVQALVIGPGLGTDDETIAAVRRILVHAASKGIPTVIDADAIHAMPIASWPVDLVGVATPHLKEFKTWMGQVSPYEMFTEALKYSLWKTNGVDEENAALICTGELDELFGLGARYSVCEGGSPRMAMGGTGDLLAGAIGGLMAVGMSPWSATRLAAWLMRRAGEMAETELGPGMVASDIPLYLAKVLAQRLET